MEKISVVIPCFNSGKTINRTVSSVKAQTWKNVEIIIVNDGSTDSYTKKILKEFKNVQIINQLNKGLPSARNAGIRKSNSNYLLFLDADDWVEKNAIEIMFKSLKKNNSDYVFCNTNLEGDKSGEQNKYYNFFEQLFLNHVPYFILIKKEVIMKVGLYDENMISGYEDWELNLRLGKEGYFPKKVEQSLFHYNVSNSGMLNSISKRKHATILKYIKKKHKSLFTLLNIIKIYIRWRRKKKNYSLIIYITLYIINFAFSNSFINKLFYLLLKGKVRLYNKKK